MNSLERKAAEMRNAIDMIEGAIMGLGDFVDLPRIFGPDSRDELVLAPKLALGDIRRVCKAVAECTRIINSEDFNPDQLRHRREKK